jgi:hypothetical protein
MKSLETPFPTCPPPKPAKPDGRIVWCIHCFRILGRESSAISRTNLLADHTCIESRMAKEPAAPPPYN